MEERRKSKRGNLISFFRVFDRETDKVIGHLKNISTEGVMIMCEIPVEKDSDYYLKMDLTSVMNFEQHVIFDARCAWIKHDFESDGIIAGFEMLKINTKDVDIIKRLMNQFSV